jgi:hypothetical protein
MVDTFDKLLWELERCWMSTTRRLTVPTVEGVWGTQVFHYILRFIFTLGGTRFAQDTLHSVIGALATIMVAFDANAFSISPVPNQSSNVTLVAGGCGLGFHRGPYGGCRPNWIGEERR